MLLVLKPHIAANPTDLGFLGRQGRGLATENVTNLIEQAWGVVAH
jgi:hypothetical protein